MRTKTQRIGTRAALALLLGVVLLVALGCGGQSAPSSESGASGGQTSEPAANDDLAKIKAAGKITFATDGAYPPDEFTDQNGQLVGFDIDLGKAIAKELGVQYDVKIVEWDGIIPGLVTGKYDAILSSMNDTEERRQQVDFIDYISMGQVIVVKAGNPKNIQSLDDLKGKTIAVQTGTTNADVAKDIEGTNVKLFDTFTDALLAVSNGQADASILDEPVARYYGKTAPDRYVVVGQPFNEAPMGIAIRKNQPNLKKAIEDALNKLKSDGTYDKIYADWFGTK
ncbi:MAG: basic amino acid ABC transporter substrate-binding protein [Clostridia bacterium]|nr:basic amino acid ABC transporter substrate-binding protein [Clostridia bacterium]